MGFYFADGAWDEYLAAEKDAKKRIDRLLKSLNRGETIGHSEPLRGDLSGFYSVRINEKDRLVYRIVGGTVEVYTCCGHYGDH